MAAGEPVGAARHTHADCPGVPGGDRAATNLYAFMDAYPAVSARLHLADRAVKLIDEGVDIALRIGHLPDSTTVAIRVGEVRRVVTAAPRYLSRHLASGGPAIDRTPDIAMNHFGLDSWSFPPVPGSCVPRTVHFTPRLVVNSIRGAVASAVEGRGVTRVFSCQIAGHLRQGELEIVLAGDEDAPIPVHLLTPTGRLSVPKARAFVDFAVPQLRAHFARLAKDVEEAASGAPRGTLSAEPDMAALVRCLAPAGALLVPAASCA